MLIGCYFGANGKGLILTILNEDKLWTDFCAALEIDEIAIDRRFATRPNARRGHRR